MSLHAFRQITIVGLGLIGGSVAKALRASDDRMILLAVDRGNVGVRSDIQNTVSEFIDVENLASKRDLVAESDAIVLCQPVSSIADSISKYVAQGCVVTDTGSTKRHIVQRAASLPGNEWYVPGHPMAGKAQGGFDNATTDLFVDRPWILCPDQRHPEAVSRVEAFVQRLGARVVHMSPEEHDRAMAIVSHVPQLISSWLQLEGQRRDALDVAGPAFRDMTRVAGGSDAIWRDIFETNADQVGSLLRDGALALAALADAMLSNPPKVERVLELLSQARNAKT